MTPKTKIPLYELDTYFIDDGIKTDLLSRSWYKFRYTSYSGLVFDFYDSSPDAGRSHIYFKCCCYFIDYFNPLKKVFNLHIILIDGPHKKTFPARKVPLDRRHVNSGVHIHYDTRSDSKIIIYRREEMMKVMIHELIHEFCPHLKYELHGVSINEAFVEAYGCILYGLFYCLLNKKSYDDFFKAELKYHELQSDRILSRVTNDRYNILQYYVLKKELLRSELFIQFIMTNKGIVDDEVAIHRILKSLPSDIFICKKQPHIQYGCSLKMNKHEMHIKRNHH